MDIIKSRNGVPIRLTMERWFHITEEHSEMAGYYFDVIETVQEPESVFKGKAGELIALREISPGKYMVTVYKEMNNEDGFVITAFLTKRIAQIKRREKLWPQ